MLVWQGQMVSQIGSQAFVVATMLWIKHATQSATLMGVVMMLGTLPYILLGGIGGVVADRASRKRIMVVCDLSAGVAVLILAALMALAPQTTALLVVGVCAVAVLLGTTGAFLQPAMVAVIPTLVPPDRLAAANSLREGTGDVAALVGQALGGVAYRLLGVPLLLLIDGVSYLFAAAATSRAAVASAPASPEPRGHSSLRAQLRQGLAYVGDQRGLTALIVVSTIANFFAAPFAVVLPFFVEDSLGATSDWFGYLIACAGGGGLVGYALAGTTSRARGAPVLLSCLFATSVCVAALARAATPMQAALLLAAAGASGSVFNIGVVTLIQRRTPDAMRGRVFGLAQALAMAAAPAAMLAAGALADATGRDARLIFAVCGVALVAVTVCAAAHRPLRDYMNHFTPDPRAHAS